MYGDSVILLCQNAIIIIQIWALSKDINFTEKVGMGAVMLGYIFIVFQDKGISDHMWEIIVLSNTLFCNRLLLLFSALFSPSSDFQNIPKQIDGILDNVHLFACRSRLFCSIGDSIS